MAVKESLTLIRTKLDNMRSMVSCLKLSVKKRDFYFQIKIELKCSAPIPSLDVDTRWTSTFRKVLRSFNARSTVNAFIVRLEKPNTEPVEETEW